MTQEGGLTRAEKRFLLALARETIERAVRGQSRPVVEERELSPALRKPADTFVTLYSLGELRGCIGSRTGKEPLYLSVMDSAEASALRDPRFPPVTTSELPGLEVSVSVLTQPRPLECTSPADLRELLQPYTHGVILTNGLRRALYLPQVWEHFQREPDIYAAFLSSLSRKAGDMTGTLWKDPATRYEVFEAETFRESDEDMRPAAR